jgi:hypothetical protein
MALPPRTSSGRFRRRITGSGRVVGSGRRLRIVGPRPIEGEEVSGVVTGEPVALGGFEAPPAKTAKARERE